MVVQALAEGKGETARFGLKEAGVQSYEPTCLRASHRQANRQNSRKRF